MKNTKIITIINKALNAAILETGLQYPKEICPRLEFVKFLSNKYRDNTSVCDPDAEYKEFLETPVGQKYKQSERLQELMANLNIGNVMQPDGGMIDVIPFGVTGHNTNDRTNMSMKGSIEDTGNGGLLEDLKKAGK